MIYIPHPGFKFEGSGGGWVLGSVNNPSQEPSTGLWGSVSWENMYGRFSQLHPDKIEAKFKKAASHHWQDSRNFKNDRAFCFLREDGNEFAIRFISNYQLDVIGYWVLCNASHEPDNIWPLGGHCPDVFQEFIRWLEAKI